MVLELTDDGELVLEPGPGLVAHVAIVVARAGDDRVIARMDDRMTAIEITGETLDDLRLGVARYASSAIRSITDPGYGNVWIGLNAAMRSGADYDAARQGAFFDADAF